MALSGLIHLSDRKLHPGRTKALEVSLLEQILILLRHHVCLNLAHEVHRHDHNDQQRCTTEVERNVETHVQEFRHQAAKHQVNRTAKRQQQQHLIALASSSFTGAKTSNERTAHFQLLYRFTRVENQSRVEIGKENNHCSVKQCV